MGAMTLYLILSGEAVWLGGDGDAPTEDAGGCTSGNCRPLSYFFNINRFLREVEWTIIFVEYIDREGKKSLHLHLGCRLGPFLYIYSLQEFAVYASLIYQIFFIFFCASGQSNLGSYVPKPWQDG